MTLSLGMCVVCGDVCVCGAVVRAWSYFCGFLWSTVLHVYRWVLIKNSECCMNAHSVLMPTCTP